jgi:hypothetical protein
MKNLILLVCVALVCVSVAYGGTITPSSNDAVDIYQLRKELVRAVNNKCLLAAGLKYNATDTECFATTNTITTVHSGMLNSAAAVASQAFSATTPVIAAGKRGYIIIGVNSSDVYSSKHSQAVSYDHELIVPLLDEGIAPVGLIKIVAGADGSFTPGTTGLDDASCTITITDMHSLPLSLDLRQR